MQYARRRLGYYWEVEGQRKANEKCRKPYFRKCATYSGLDMLAGVLPFALARGTGVWAAVVWDGVEASSEVF